MEIFHSIGYVRCLYKLIFQVGSNYTLKEDTLYHSSCLSICPDQCNLGWSFFDIDIAWTPDNQVTVECGKIYELIAI